MVDAHNLAIKSHDFKSHPECDIFQTMAGATDVCNLRNRTKSLSLYSLRRHNNIDLESAADFTCFFFFPLTFAWKMLCAGVAIQYVL